MAPPDRPPAGGLIPALLAALSATALVAVLVAGRELSAPPAPLALAVFFLPHLVLTLAGLTWLAWVRFPRQRALLWLLAGILGLGGVTWGRTWAMVPDAGEGEPLRVLTWNVHRLWGGPRDGGDAPACVAAEVEAAEPDVLALLEVSAADVGHLSERLGLTCAHADYHGTGDPDDGGLAVCTRGERWGLLSGRGLRYVEGDPWHYVFAEVERGEDVVNLVAVHLVPYAVSSRSFRRQLVGGDLRGLGRNGEATFRAQGVQSAALLERVSRFRDPTVLTGDFNSTRDTALHTRLRHTLTDAWTPGGSGLGATVRLFGWVPLRVDHTYVTSEIAVTGARVPSTGCSDHRPVLVDLALQP